MARQTAVAGASSGDGMETDIDRLFQEITQTLRERSLPFLLIGGHAVNFHGVLRATQDIDFMIAGTDASAIEHLMLEAGFTNFSSHENVLFFNRPGSALRIDFLKVDQATLRSIFEQGIDGSYLGATGVRIPRIEDLLAMKIFALSQGGIRREFKDLSDILELSRLHQIPFEPVITDLCARFASPAVRETLRRRFTH